MPEQAMRVENDGVATLLNSDWLKALDIGDALDSIFSYLAAQKQAGKQIYPPHSKIFSGFNLTLPESVKVVILGQDPYHGAGQAHGLSFSVPRGVAIPPSLRNIYKELASDLGIVPAVHGHLGHWSKQGVLLLNSVLSVEAGRAASHRDIGWEPFTDRVVETIAKRTKPVVFMLWGRDAQRKGRAIDSIRHLVLKAPHPSPLSAYRGFLGCQHFSQANAFLQQSGQTPINWELPIQ